jgi:hypothetical protein
MQIGSEVYCDTVLIADVLERIQPEPTLYPQARAGTMYVHFPRFAYQIESEKNA